VTSGRNSSCSDYFLSSYFAAIEYYDLPAGDPAYTAFSSVTPTDEIEVYTWSAGSTGTPYTTTGAYGWYYMEDLSTNPVQVYGSTSIQKPSGGTFGTPAYADFIMENPFNEAQLLAVYGVGNSDKASMFSVEASDPTNGWTYVYNDPNTTVNMVCNTSITPPAGYTGGPCTSGTVLSASTAVNSSNYTYFTWENAGP
jgi:hypothetical protein